MQQLGGLSCEQFLKEYWQKKPLLIQQAFPDYQSPITAEEFAGLACEENVESRLIQEKGGAKPWQLRHGPFAEEDFTSMPDSHWTLLVQSVDHHIPELASLLDEFNFIPNWRIDDLMVSFAQDQGSVGPHLDNYDVFLLQVEGKRQWSINDGNYADDDLLPETDLKILANFQSQQDWVLESGDMLYLPPGVAHHGVALGDCLTFSIGFRAPNRRELMYAFSGELDEAIEEVFYSDPNLSVQESSGEITTEQLVAIRELMLSPKVDDKEFNSWFGAFITEKSNELEYENGIISKEQFFNKLKAAGVLIRNGNVRLSYISNDESISLFVSGDEYDLSKNYLPLVNYLCENHYLDYAHAKTLFDEQAVLDLLFNLYSENYFFIDD